MNLPKLFETQRALDEHIMKEHPEMRRNKSNLDWKLLALQVELGECANEWRGFKKWSKDQEPRREKLLVEYVDCLHLLLSTGLEKTDFYGTQVEIRYIAWTDVAVVPFQDVSIIHQFNGLFLEIGTLYDAVISEAFDHQTVEDAYSKTWSAFLGLGEMLGFSWEQVEAAYYTKNQINHERQENGY